MNAVIPQYTAQIGEFSHFREGNVPAKIRGEETTSAGFYHDPPFPFYYIK
jgi:hypothetical protein